MKVKEIMTIQVITTSPEALVQEVVALMLEHNVSGLPVVNGDKRLVGIISETDVLSRLFPSYGEYILRPWEAVQYGFTDEKRDAVLEKKISDIMSTNVVTIGPEANILKGLGTLMAKKIRRLPVVDEKTEELLGIVTQYDIFRSLLRLGLDKD